MDEDSSNNNSSSSSIPVLARADISSSIFKLTISRDVFREISARNLAERRCIGSRVAAICAQQLFRLIREEEQHVFAVQLTVCWFISPALALHHFFPIFSLVAFFRPRLSRRETQTPAIEYTNL
jgi:hypothetical protein